jgi:anti-sigma factor RsiW
MIALEAGGDLPDARRRRLERHLPDCADCRSLLEELKESRQVTNSLAEQEIAVEILAKVRARVLHQIDSETQALEQTTWLRSLTNPQARWAVATVVLALAVAIWIWLGVPGFRGEQGRPTVEAQATPAIHQALPSPRSTGAQVAEEEKTVIAASQDPEVEHAASDRSVSTMPEHSTFPEKVTVVKSLSVIDEARPDQPVAPMIIKLVSDQEDVVIYWLVGEEPQDKESEDVV